MENIVLHQHTKIELPVSILGDLLTSMIARAEVTPTAQRNIPMIGDPWPDEPGGTYAGILRAEPGFHYDLIVSPRTMDVGGLAWGSQGTEITGANSRWDGLSNTQALLASGLELPTVKAATGTNPPKDGEWYLPAQRELALCWANVPDIFETDDWYWSSTQYSANNAWMQDFSIGDQDVNGKGLTGRVRPVRRLIIR